MLHVVVLGAGRVGGAMAKDLSQDFRVTVADRAPSALARLRGTGPDTRLADVSRTEGVAEAVADADLVVGAVPGFMGFAMARAVLEAGKPLVDISFFDEDCFELDALAKRQNLTAIVDCGVAPGCGNLILGDLSRQWDRITSFECLVGGLPVVRTWPYEYKAGFSPIDVIEEYTRPARYVKDGRVVTLPALSEPELLDFEGLGTLESFNTDGLRSIIKTFPKVPSMKEKTLRYPGHIEKMRMLRESGFFGKDKILVGGVEVSPLDLTTALLFPLWFMEEGDEDFTVMRVVVEGEKNGQRMRKELNLLDRYDRTTRTTSMARTTGYTCTAAVRLLAKGGYSRKGISPPEFLGQEPGAWDFIREDLARHGVVFTES
ncbi:saccharopine dehydrogenase family protein [Geothrix sp. PMB-07]|uniref:saccharopine dehydrogenase family protein n=1 Tax=Geothrix sp. PMB-07 TaxID=3068640 RepID=UPI0027426C97|nr:saccharopine dehydrogenase C-terminal domain-containing protein [Geothrix sp. PMB-07]WLT33177.1 saccharopine dehydrogenase C-terminal domain-containing protein [Geothrix sp. PMB-07]